MNESLNNEQTVIFNDNDSINNEFTVRSPQNVLGRIDRYLLQEKLGHGAFGAVFRAYDTVSKIFVAIKILPSLLANDKSEMERVRANFALISQLSHPHIASLRFLHQVKKVDNKAIKECGTAANHFIVVMDLATGQPLTSWQDSFTDKKVPIHQAAKVIAQLADAVDYAHNKGVLHRDIKPDNIVISSNGDIQLLDFGLAAEIRSSMDNFSSNTGVAGTRPYMSPEQWLGEPLNAASDQYSLGILFHELITGKVPFLSAFASGDIALIRQIVCNDQPKLTGITSKYAKALKKVLAKKSAQRYPNCSKFTEQLTLKTNHKSFFKKIAIIIIPIIVAGISGFIIHNHQQQEKLINQYLMDATNAFAKNELKIGMENLENIFSIKQNQRKAINLRNEKFKELFQAAESAFHANELTKAYAILLKAEIIDDSKRQTLELKKKIAYTQAEPLKKEATAAWNEIRNIDPNQNFTTKLLTIKNQLADAISSFNKEEYSPAVDGFLEVCKQTVILKQLDANRQKVKKRGILAVDAKKIADDNDAKSFASNSYKKAEIMIKSAEQTFNSGDFKKADSLWQECIPIFQQAAKDANITKQHWLKATNAKNSYEQTFANINSTLIKASMPKLWSKAIKLENDAKKYYDSGDYQQATNCWDSSINLLFNAQSWSKNINNLKVRIALASKKASAGTAEIESKQFWDRAERHFNNASTYFKQGDYSKADGEFKESYDDYKQSYVEYKRICRIRESAQLAAKASENARRNAIQCNAQQEAKIAWQEGERFANSATAEFRRRNFEIAKDYWLKACQYFNSATTEGTTRQQERNAAITFSRKAIEIRNIAKRNMVHNRVPGLWKQAEKLELFANSAFKKRNYKQASSSWSLVTQAYVSAEESAKTISILLKGVKSAEKIAKNINANHYARTHWQQAINDKDNADRSYRLANYDTAIMRWKKATKAFNLAQKVATCNKEKELLEKEMQKYDINLFENYGGSSWDKFNNYLKSANSAMKYDNWQDATKSWISAQRYLPSLIKSANSAKDKHEKIKNLHVKIKAAKRRNLWQDVKGFADEILQLNPQNRDAIAIKKEALIANTRIIIIAKNINGKLLDHIRIEMAGKIYHGGKSITIKPNKGYTLKVYYTGRGGNYKPTITNYRGHSKGLKTINVILRK